MALMQAIDRPRFRAPAWLLVFATGMLVAALRIGVPGASWWPIAAVATGLGAAGVLAWAVHRRVAGWPGWAFVAAGEALNAALLAGALPGSSPATAIHSAAIPVVPEILAYGLAILGVILLVVRTQLGREVDAWLDAAILGAASSIVFWEAVLEPGLDDGSIGGNLTAVAGVVVEAVLFALVARIVLRRAVPISVTLLALVVMAFLVSDAVALLQHNLPSSVESLLQAAWFLGYATTAALAIHPVGITGWPPPGEQDETDGSPASSPVSSASVRADRIRLVAIGIALAIGPVAFVYHTAVHSHTGPDAGFRVLVLALASLTTNTLAILRIAFLIRRLRDDVRRRALAERERQTLEGQLRLISELAPIGIFMNDPTGVPMYQNDRWSQLAGLTPGAGLGQGWEEAIHPDDLAHARAALAEGTASGREWQLEHRFVLPDGSSRWVAVQVKPVRDAGDEIRGWVGTTTDITRIAEDRIAAEEREALVAALIEQSPVGIEVFDRDGTSLEYNDALRQILGLRPRDQEAPFNVLETLAPALERQGSEVRKAFAGETVFAPSVRIPIAPADPDDPPRDAHLRITYFPLLDASGGVRRVIAFMEDISAQVAADEARRDMEEKIQETAKLEALGVLAGGIAHDFNNLLVAILGHAGLARSEVTPGSDAAADLAAIETAAQRAADLARQMLAYSGRGRFTVTPIALDALLTEMGDLLGRTVAKNADITYDFASDVPPVMADATQLRQLALNLIVNASDALDGRPGSIRLRTDLAALEQDDPTIVPGLDPEPGRYVMFEVADTGEGMDRATLGQVFMPFFTTKAAGRGLGLAAALGIVKGHHGAIRVTSTPGRGTTFQVLLPPADATPEAVARSRGTDSTLRTGHILLVDDEESVRILGRRVLERAGFEVTEADDGPAAIEAFRQSPDLFHAVLLDVTLPTLDGLTVLEQIREIRGDIRIVVSSGWSEEEVAARIGGRHGVRFLQKPYRAEALVEILQ
jgi:PAS domain S-box-containing protein